MLGRNPLPNYSVRLMPSLKKKPFHLSTSAREKAWTLMSFQQQPQFCFVRSLDATIQKRKKEAETPSSTVTSVLMRVVVKEISQILYKLENL